MKGHLQNDKLSPNVCMELFNEVIKILISLNNPENLKWGTFMDQNIDNILIPHFSLSNFKHREESKA